MQVFWDPQVFTWQEHGGISRVFAELYREFVGNDYGVEIVVPPFHGASAFAADAGLPQKPAWPVPGRRNRRRLKRWLNQASVAHTLRRRPPPLIHPTFYEADFLQLASDIPFVLTVHDMIHERFADSWLVESTVFRAKKKVLIERATRFIATSESTRQDMIELMSIEPDRIDVIYHGTSRSVSAAASAANKPSGGKPYVLFAGHRTVYKNFTSFLRAAAPVLTARDLDLLCIGGGPLTSDELDLASSLGVASRVAQKTLSDQELGMAFRQAELFVFPSLFEGFGLPLLEAMACGCPVAASDIAPFREVAADAAAWFDPEDEAAMAAAIERVLDDTALRSELVAAGTERCKTFTWQRSAELTAATYRRALESG